MRSVVRHTMQALPLGQMINTRIKTILCVIALMVLSVPVLGQGTAIEPCQATPTPASGGARNDKISTRSKLLPVDASVPDDPEVEKVIAPYRVKVLELSVTIGKLAHALSKSRVGGGSLGNFVTDGIKNRAEAKLGKPVDLAVVNVGGLRKNEIAAGDLRSSDIFELLPFENALIAFELNGTQLLKLLGVATRDAQSGARIQFRWDEQNRPAFISGKLIDEQGNEKEIDPNKLYTVITIDYLLRLASGPYAILQEAKSTAPLDLTLRDAIISYVKSETAAGRTIRVATDSRFVQVGPGPKTNETPR